MPLVDTHCHIHSDDYPLDPEVVIANARAAGVTRLICVGTSAEDSERAVAFAAAHDNCWASVGLHPHEAKMGEGALTKLRELVGALTPDIEASKPLRLSPLSHPSDSLRGRLPKADMDPLALRKAESLGETEARDDTTPVATPPKEKTSGSAVPLASSRGGTASAAVAGDAEGRAPSEPNVSERDGKVALSGRTRDAFLAESEPEPKIVAIGECGLDYFYNHSSRQEQEKALRFQIELALQHDLPLVFHVRDAFDDFWPIFDSYPGVRGVLHSFTDNQANLDKALARGLYIGVNGIVTFTKNDWQLEVAKAIPADRILFETDAPFLTPVPLRGTMNEPANVSLVCQFMADLRQESVDGLTHASTKNAVDLFALK